MQSSNYFTGGSLPILNPQSTGEILSRISNVCKVETYLKIVGNLNWSLVNLSI